MSDKSSESRMRSLDEASELLCGIAGPRGAGDGVKALLLRAHRRLAAHGWTFNRVRDVYHRDRRIRISEAEMRELRRLCAADDAARIAKDMRHDVLARIERIEAALAISDADFHRHHIDALRCATGRDDSSVD